MTDFVLCVCGGRDYTKMGSVFTTLDTLHKERRITKLIHGGARGADRLAGYWARVRHVPEVVFKADWEQYGKRAGYCRNEDMARAGPDLVLAFPGGRGTAMMLEIAESYGLPIQRVP